MFENNVSKVKEITSLFAKRFRPAFAGALRAGRSKAPLAGSLSPSRLVNFRGIGFDFLSYPYCETVSKGERDGVRGKRSSDLGKEAVRYVDSES